MPGRAWLDPLRKPPIGRRSLGFDAKRWDAAEAAHGAAQWGVFRRGMDGRCAVRHGMAMKPPIGRRSLGFDAKRWDATNFVLGKARSGMSWRVTAGHSPATQPLGEIRKNSPGGF